MKTASAAKKPATIKTIRAEIDQTTFFASMKHLFASSFTVMGELIQNSRRAKATAIHITADVKTRTITVQDDGVGVDDFQNLLSLMKSGWDTETTLHDKPFGMGFFSCFYAADKVCVESNGMTFTASIKDIVAGKSIDVVPLGNAVDNLTVVKLIGVNQELMKKEGSAAYQLETFSDKLLELVKGFDTPVNFNGHDLARPHAQANLDTILTPIGYIQVDGINDGNKWSRVATGARVYLQGLPICESEFRPDAYGGLAVIHLDSVLFTAVMPDRKALYDKDVQIPKIKAALLEFQRSRLIQIKSEIAPVEFAKIYWKHTSDLDLAHLLNDIPYVSSGIFGQVEAVRIQDAAGDVYRYIDKGNNDDELISIERFKSGEIKAVKNCPECATDDPWAPTFLKLMQSAGAWKCLTSGLSDEHWVFQYIYDFNELTFDAVVDEANSKSEVFYGQYDTSANISLATRVTLNARSALHKNEIVLTSQFENDWVLVPLTFDDFGCCTAYKCWLIGAWDRIDHPKNALHSYFDTENGAYLEDLEKSNELEWKNKVSSLRNEHMILSVERTIEPHYLNFQEDQMAEIGFVKLEAKHRLDDKYDSFSPAFKAVDQDFIQALKLALFLETNHKGITNEQVQRALLMVVQPGLRVGGPLDGEYIAQW